MLPIPIVVVAYGNADDVVECLDSLRNSNSEPAFDVYVCENGGDEAFGQLCARVCAANGPCVRADVAPPCRTEGFTAVKAFRLTGTKAAVFIGNAGENLGYGGGVNRWLEPLRGAGERPGVLVLNPDSTVEPDALGALVRYSASHGKGMVTGRIVMAGTRDRIAARGLRWRPLLASAEAVDKHARIDAPVNSKHIESEIDSPSGSFLYITWKHLSEIGLMKEDYFLYFEDIEWGLRSKRTNNIGYADDAVVYHKGGTTTGPNRSDGRSPLSTYLIFRNRVLFVRSEYPVWLPWTIVVTALRAVELGLHGQARYMPVAFRGLVDGLRGRAGRPDALLRDHAALRARAA